MAGNCLPDGINWRLSQHAERGIFRQLHMLSSENVSISLSLFPCSGVYLSYLFHFSTNGCTEQICLPSAPINSKQTGGNSKLIKRVYNCVRVACAMHVCVLDCCPTVRTLVSSAFQSRQCVQLAPSPINSRPVQ